MRRNIVNGKRDSKNISDSQYSPSLDTIQALVKALDIVVREETTERILLVQYTAHFGVICDEQYFWLLFELSSAIFMRRWGINIARTYYENDAHVGT